MSKLWKLWLFGILLCSVPTLRGQIAGNYSFSSTSSPYINLPASSTDVPALLSDGGEADIPIGFNFLFEGGSYDSVAATSDGFLSFVTGSNSSLSNNLTAPGNISPLVAPLWDDLDGSANGSRASYELSGTAPNRVFTFEWRNWEWSWNSTDSVVSFQVKLYENTNQIEFHYRWECAACITGPDASIGLSGANTFLSISDIGTGAPTASNLTEDSSIDTVVTNQVFTFVPPACPGPILDSLTNITASSFDLFWSNTGTDSVIVNWGPAGFNQATSTMAQLDTTDQGTLSISGLMSGVAYDVYLRRICGNALSPWNGPITVRTQCSVQNLPYTESFDFDLGCFAVADSGTSADTWGWISEYQSFFGTENLDGNPGFAFADSDGAGFNVTMNEYLISPVIDASSITGSLILEFDQYYNDLSSNADVEVFDGSQWVNVLAQTSSIGAWGAPDQQRIDITQYANANLQVRFHYYNATFAWYWAIDNFSVTEVLCNPSSNLNVVASSADSITINWQPGSGAVYGIEYGPAGFTQGAGTLASTTDTSFTATGLSANSSYDFYIIDSCSASNFSQWVGPFTANTSCTAVPMPYLESFDTWALSCWDSTGSDFFWVPYIGTSGDNYAEASFWSNASGKALLKSRPITISQDAQIRLYWSHSYSTVYPDDQFIVRAQVAGTTSWDTILNLKGAGNFNDPSAGNTTPGNFIEEIIVLDPATYTGNDVFIELIGVTDFGPDLFVNDFNVEAVPPCPKPQTLTDSLTTANTTYLHWEDATAAASSYEVWFGAQGFFQGTQTAGGARVTVNTDSLFVDTLTQVTCYEFLVRAICGLGDTSDWAGPVSFCTPPSCPAPTNANFISATITTADISWTSGGASDFNVEYGPVGFALGSGITVNSTNDTLQLTGLTAGTTYEYYVRDSCGAGDVSTWEGPVTFNTAYRTNFQETFDNSAYSSPGWVEADGRLTSNTTFTSVFSSWGFDDFGNDPANSTAARANIWLGNQYEWLISPSIYLDPALTNLQVEFDAAITAFASTNQGYFGSDDSLVIVISTDNGATWSDANILWSKTNGDTIDAAGEHYIIPLSGYSGYVRFGIYAGSTINDPEDNDWYVDNFEVRTPRACNNPSGLSADGFTTTGATARWIPADTNALGWEILLTTSGQPAASGQSFTASANDSIAFTGLNSSTTYCFYVIEQCANGFSDTIGPECFTTLCTPFTAPYADNFDANNWTADDVSFSADNSIIGNCWTGTPEVNQGYSFRVRSGSTGSSSTGPLADSTGGNYTYAEASAGSSGDTALLESPLVDISSLSNPELTFAYHFYGSDIDRMYIQIGQGGSYTNVDTIIGQVQSSSSDAWLGININLSAYASQTITVRFMAISAGCCSGDLALDAFSIDEAGAVACPIPSALSSSAANCDTLTINWTTVTGGSIIQYGPAGFTPGTGSFTGVVTPPFNLSGLALNTDYDIWVADTCQGDTSAFAGPITVKTDSVGPVLASFTANVGTPGATSASVSFDASASTNAVSYNWDFGNGNTASGLNVTEDYTSDNVYNVTLSVTDRCGNTDDTTIAVTIMGISLAEQTLAEGMELYPNPNRGTFTLHTPDANESLRVSIADAAGRKVYARENLEASKDYRIELQNMSPGVYNLTLENSELRATRRIIIRK